MWHEVISAKWGIFVESVSDIEDQGKTMRYFQKIENEWIASRSKVSVDELNEMVKRKELWVSGLDAIKYGFADKYIGTK